MPKLTAEQKAKNEAISLQKHIETLVWRRIDKNKGREKIYQAEMDILADHFWYDFPAYRDETLDKRTDKARLTKLFEKVNLQNQNLF